MNNKFYVSLEAARLLKEKGYNEQCDYCFYYDDYHDKWDFDSPYNLFDDAQMYYNNETIDDEMYSMPTKAEAIDWLESKRMRINIIYDWIECKWYFTIINGSPTVKSITELEVSDSVFYKTRLEAEEAAIIKALELL